jgi:hypothetical protein
MKKPFLFAGRRSRAPFHSPVALVFGLAIACSSTDPERVAQTQPSTPAGPAAPGPSIPGPGMTDPSPVSAPPENDGPGATETNWLTPPCGKQRPDAGAVEGAADAGAPDLGADAGAAGDRCISPEAP